MVNDNGYTLTGALESTRALHKPQEAFQMIEPIDSAISIKIECIIVRLHNQ
jgi:hypothetical protein